MNSRVTFANMRCECTNIVLPSRVMLCGKIADCGKFLLGAKFHSSHDGHGLLLTLVYGQAARTLGSWQPGLLLAPSVQSGQRGLAIRQTCVALLRVRALTGGTSKIAPNHKTL